MATGRARSLFASKFSRCSSQMKSGSGGLRLYLSWTSASRNWPTFPQAVPTCGGPQCGFHRSSAILQRDYYQVLGIPRNAREEDIKSAYREQAMRWHPDKNQDNLEEAEEKFKAVAEAFQVLGKPQSRQNYDAFGTAGSGHGMGPSAQDMAKADEMFNQMYGEFFKMSRGAAPQKGGRFHSNMQHMDQEEIRKVFSSFGMNQQQQLYTRNGKTFIKTTRIRRNPDGSMTEETKDRELGSESKQRAAMEEMQSEMKQAAKEVLKATMKAAVSTATENAKRSVKKKISKGLSAFTGLFGGKPKKK